MELPLAEECFIKMSGRGFLVLKMSSLKFCLKYSDFAIPGEKEWKR